MLRLKIAAGTRVPPHWHPVDEHLTVMSGTFYMGTGERFDESTATALTAGTYTMMPKDARHFGWTGSETIVQIHGVGPFKTYLVEQPAAASGLSVVASELQPEVAPILLRGRHWRRTRHPR